MVINNNTGNNVFNVSMDFMMRQVNHNCVTRGVAGFRVAYRLGGSLIRAPDNEESELSALLLMYAVDLVLLTTSELHLESAIATKCHRLEACSSE